MLLSQPSNLIIFWWQQQQRRWKPGRKPFEIGQGKKPRVPYSSFPLAICGNPVASRWTQKGNPVQSHFETVGGDQYAGDFRIDARKFTEIHRLYPQPVGKEAKCK